MQNIYKLRLGPLPSSIFMILVVSFVLTSCKKNTNHPGYVYLPDMDVSRAYDTYSENPVFDDGLTLRVPVEGTIPRGHVPYPYVKDDNDLLIAGKQLHSPLEPSADLLARGEVLFNRFCIQCHGPNGDGQGVLYTSKRFPLPPGDLTAEKTVNRPDGELFHILTVGYGSMPAHASQIQSEDRWKIIHYIREELQDQASD